MKKVSNSHYSKNFEKMFRKAPVKIQKAFVEKAKLLINNVNNPTLNNHQLHGHYKGYRSINITGDWRALYTETQSHGEIIAYFEFLGTHSELYK